MILFIQRSIHHSVFRLRVIQARFYFKMKKNLNRTILSAPYSHQRQPAAQGGPITYYREPKKPGSPIYAGSSPWLPSGSGFYLYQKLWNRQKDREHACFRYFLRDLNITGVLWLFVFLNLSSFLCLDAMDFSSAQSSLSKWSLEVLGSYTEKMYFSCRSW